MTPSSPARWYHVAAASGAFASRALALSGRGPRLHAAHASGEFADRSAFPPAAWHDGKSSGTHVAKRPGCISPFR